MYKTPEGIPVYQENDRLRIALSILSGRRTIADLDENERFVLAGRLCSKPFDPFFPPFPESDEDVQLLIEEILYDRLQHEDDRPQETEDW